MGGIHVHHSLPISEFGGFKEVNLETGLITLCENCKALNLWRCDRTLSLDELKGMGRGKWIFESW